MRTRGSLIGWKSKFSPYCSMIDQWFPVGGASLSRSFSQMREVDIISPKMGSLMGPCILARYQKTQHHETPHLPWGSKVLFFWCPPNWMTTPHVHFTSATRYPTFIFSESIGFIRATTRSMWVTWDPIVRVAPTEAIHISKRSQKSPIFYIIFTLSPYGVDSPCPSITWHMSNLSQPHTTLCLSQSNRTSPLSPHATCHPPLPSSLYQTQNKHLYNNNKKKRRWATVNPTTSKIVSKRRRRRGGEMKVDNF